MMGILALSGPTWKRQKTPFVQDETPLVVALDLSQSMNAIDVQPTRLQRAQQKIRDLLALRPGARTGLIAYAGSSHMVLPLTDDAKVIEMYLVSLETSLMPVVGKNPDKALKLADKMLAKETSAGTILFVTDGIADRYAHTPRERAEGPGLTVLVYSFSYRRGYPEDVSGHGGGFVFDCRALPNPGRLPEYRPLTGLDPDVRSFLGEQPEAEAFWENVQRLVDAQIGTYLGRKFTALTVSFGCTGGHHRSVFFAERLRAHLDERFPEVRVRLFHREEPYWP